MDDNKTLTDNAPYKLREIKSRLLEAHGVSSMLSWKHRFGNNISLNQNLSYCLIEFVWMLIEFSARPET